MFRRLYFAQSHRLCEFRSALFQDIQARSSHQRNHAENLCLQGKYRIWGKPDWSEPLNTYCVIVLPPAERKSAVISLMTAPLEEYEQEINSAMDAKIIESQMKKSVLEKERRMLEDRVSKGKADASELADKAKEISAFQETQPLKLFVDDVTAEKLA